MNVFFYVLKFIIGGGLIIGITFLAKYVNPKLSGVLVVAPLIATLSIVFVKYETNLQTTQQLILSSIYYIIPTLIFLVAMYFLIGRINLIYSLVISYFIWGITVLVVQKMIN